jgi:hypothetical protein
MQPSSVEWRKSSYSQGNGGQCIEVAGSLPQVVAVRDSKDPGGARLTFQAASWIAFTDAVKNGTR